MKRCLTTILHIIALLSLTSLALAGPGKVAGTIVDANGDAVFGANVQIMETKQGANVVNPDGSYVILGVAPGAYTIRVSSIGYGQQEFRGVQVSSDLTTTINATLAEQALVGDSVIIIAKKNPTVKLDVSGKENRLSGSELTNFGGGQVVSVIAKQPGFKVDPDGGLHVRGGRDTEAKYVVDGQAKGDPMYNSSKRLINTSALNVEEIEILTGGDASTGGYQSALIRVTTPEGKMDAYNGIIEYRSDRLFNNYSFDTDQADYSFSGPVPFVNQLFNLKKKDNKLSFFTSGTAKLTNTYTPYNIDRDPSDYLALGFDVPERQSNDYSTFWKLTYRMDPARKFNFSYTREHSLWDVYPDGEASIAGNYGWQYKYNPENRPYSRKTSDAYNLQFQHNVSQKTFYEVTLGRSKTATQVRPRGKNPDEFTQNTDVEDARIFTQGGFQSGGADINSNGVPDGYVDANGDGEYNGEGEGYYDANGNGAWDRGEDWVDLNGNGVFDDAEPWVDRSNSQGQNNPGVYDSWDPFIDLNGNGRWDDAEPQLSEQDWNQNGQWDGEQFQDANGNGRYDGNGEGYDDRNLDGEINKKTNFTDADDTGEGYLDGDFVFDTGEPFIDSPDEDGIFNGVWNTGEVWLDLPTSTSIGGGRLGISRNGRYDGPNGSWDEYELFCYPADREFGMDPRLPVIYTWANILEYYPAGEPEWLNAPFDTVNFVPYYYTFIPGKSTWINRTTHDTDDPIFNPQNFQLDNGEYFYDYNQNGTWDPETDDFLNPGQWDDLAFWQDRRAIEYSAKMDVTSQANKFHELKSGLEVKYRDLKMQSIQAPDLPYDNPDFPLPEDSPYNGVGDTRDFYDHKPWEGAVYFQDKMEFEGLIVRAGLRSDFIIQSDGLLQQFANQVGSGQPGALLAERGRYVIAPRLGISHPVSATSKLYFNYGHYYQTPSFQYFYRSATANISPNTEIGNPNLEYEKTVSYEVGVSTEFTENWVVDVAGYYRDVYNQIGTVETRIGPLILNRYFNLGYARARGFEFSLDKKFSSMWALTANYDFSFAYGKESAAAEGLLDRQNGVPENRNEHPLDWDETHRVSAFLTFMVSKDQHPRVLGLTMPSDWLSTVEFSYGSGLPYTPSDYTADLPDNLILANSSRKQATSTTDFRFDKFWEITKGMKVATGFEIFNLFNRKNVRDIYAETGNAYDSSHEENINEGEDGNLGKDIDHNPRNYFPPRQVVLHLKLDF